MTQITFRGKRKDTKQWVYGSLLQSDVTVSGSCYCQIHQRFADDFSVSAHDVIPETVGQLWNPSLGLTVFTGDLLSVLAAPCGSSKKRNMIAKIDLSGNGCCAVVWHENEWWHYGYFDWNSAKIIGNIYDNEELLKTYLNATN